MKRIKRMELPSLKRAEWGRLKQLYASKSIIGGRFPQSPPPQDNRFPIIPSYSEEPFLRVDGPYILFQIFEGLSRDELIEDVLDSRKLPPYPCFVI